jgi:hypothetical protein
MTPLACDGHCIRAVIVFWHHDMRHVMIKPDHVLKTAAIVLVGGGGGETGPPLGTTIPPLVEDEGLTTSGIRLTRGSRRHRHCGRAAGGARAPNIVAVVVVAWQGRQRSWIDDGVDANNNANDVANNDAKDARQP